MADNTLTLKLDKDTVLPIVEQLGKSAYAIAVAHGYKGTEQEWLDSLRGPQGPQGGTGPQGAEGPQGPRGPKGDPGSAEKTAELMKQKNIWLENSHVDTVLSKLVELLGDQLKAGLKPLAYTLPAIGQTFVDLTGEPHFFVSVNGGPHQELQSDNIRVSIPAYGEDDILIDYFDLSNTRIGGVTIKGVEVVNDKVVEVRNGQITVTVRNGKATIDITKLTHATMAVRNFPELAEPLKGATYVALKSNEPTPVNGSIGNARTVMYLLQYLTNQLKFANVDIITPQNINVFGEGLRAVNGITVNGTPVNVSTSGYGYWGWDGTKYEWHSFGQL